MPIFSADTWFHSSLTDNYIPRRWNNAFFSGNLSTGTNLVINFDLIKCITKADINSYAIYNGKMGGGLSTERQNIVISKMYFYGVFKRHWSKLLDVI